AAGTVGAGGHHLPRAEEALRVRFQNGMERAGGDMVRALADPAAFRCGRCGGGVFFLGGGGPPARSVLRWAQRGGGGRGWGVIRGFSFRRYHNLMPENCCMVLLSAIAFGFSHIALGNWLAVALTLGGGWFFASTYDKRRSLALVCIEHALYGCFLFTIGLGGY